MPTAPVSPEPIYAAEDEIPLPPEEMFAELDNSGAAIESTSAGPTAAPVQAGPTVAVLEFVGEKKPFVEVPLTYPFKWDGVVVETIVVRRLTVQAMGDFWDGLPTDGRYDRMDVYAAMCGLPAPVIRALPEPDGTRVTEACFDFLPRDFRGGSD